MHLDVGGAEPLGSQLRERGTAPSLNPPGSGICPRSPDWRHERRPWRSAGIATAAPTSTPSAAAPDRCSSTCATGPPSTWDGYGVHGNHDGTRDPYDPKDAIPSASRYLRELLRAPDGNLRQAIRGSNHSTAYVNDVLARARTYAGQSPPQLPALDSAALGVSSADLVALTGPVNLTAPSALRAPERSGRYLPGRSPPGRGPALTDARQHAGAVGICAATSCGRLRSLTRSASFLRTPRSRERLRVTSRSVV